MYIIARYPVLILAIVIIGISCTHKSDQVAPLATAPQAATAAPGAQATGDAAAIPGDQGGRLRGITPGSYSGSVDFATIKSDFPCMADADCGFTKFANAPKSTGECTCQAACEPFVVNVATRDAREEANKRLCKVDDWFGPKCPAPNCNFIEFDRFSCVDGKCQATDIDGK